jgi:hypothetical protein
LERYDDRFFRSNHLAENLAVQSVFWPKMGVFSEVSPFFQNFILKNINTTSGGRLYFGNFSRKLHKIG